MSSIQDIHALEERIYDYVEYYLGCNYVYQKASLGLKYCV